MRGTKRRYEEVQPQLQRDIVNDYRRGVRGHGYLTLAKKHQLPIQTVRSAIARAERAVFFGDDSKNGWVNGTL